MSYGLQRIAKKKKFEIILHLFAFLKELHFFMSVLIIDFYFFKNKRVIHNFIIYVMLSWFLIFGMFSNAFELMTSQTNNGYCLQNINRAQKTNINVR